MSTITVIPHPLHARQTSSAPSATGSSAPCTWSGHCLGDKCKSNDDCDNDWICSNKVCSPCCETETESALPSSTASSSSPVSSTPTTSTSAGAGGSKGGLGTASAIGIGVGIVAFLIICVSAGVWFWLRRRKRTGPFEAPNTSIDHAHSGYYGASSVTVGDDRKQLVARPYRAELPAQDRAGELSSVELVELPGSAPASGERHRDKLEREISGGLDDVISDEAASNTSPRGPRYRFEEYTVEPEYRSH